MARLAWLGRTPVLFGLLGLTLVIMLSFREVRAQVDGVLLDFIWSGAAAQERLAALSGPQRTAHFWATVLNDTAYPLAYGGLLAGIALRFGRGPGPRLALFAAATVAVDFLENTVQALALSGTADLLAAKTLLTPLKFGLSAIPALIAVYLLGRAMGEAIRDWRDKTKQKEDAR